MNAEAVVSDLVSHGVIEPDSHDSFEVTTEFKDAIEAALERLHDSNTDHHSVGELELPLTDSTVEAVAAMEAISQRVPSLDTKSTLDLALVIVWFLRSVPEQTGVPDHFLPVHGDLLPLIEAAYSPAIVYVFRHDCPPCDLVREDFEELFDPEPPEDLSLFSVFGPDAVDILREDYDVSGGPAVLFLANGRVDVRLYGAQDPMVLSTEVDKIQRRHRSR